MLRICAANALSSPKLFWSFGVGNGCASHVHGAIFAKSFPENLREENAHGSHANHRNDDTAI
jgi:hypothetical protein